MKRGDLEHFFQAPYVTLHELNYTAAILDKLCLVITINLRETHLEQKIHQPTDRQTAPPPRKWALTLKMTQNSKLSDKVEIWCSNKVKYGEFKNLGLND